MAELELMEYTIASITPAASAVEIPINFNLFILYKYSNQNQLYQVSPFFI